MTSVLVLGGGISGLLAAWHLRRTGADVAVWEAGGEPGGWAQTLPWPGPGGEPGWLERGPQGLLLGSGALSQMVAELGLGLRSGGRKGPRWLGRGDGRHPGPGTLAGMLRAPGMGLWDRVRLLAEPLVPCRPDTTEDLRAYIARRLGAGFASEVLPALVAGVFAAPPERLGVEAMPRLLRLEARGGLLLGGLREGALHTRFPFAGARHGTGVLADALAAAVGGVAAGRRALALAPTPDGRWRIESDAGPGEADQVVLAVPARTAAGLLAPWSPRGEELLADIPCVDLQVWHSRHAPVPGWERGTLLLVHPPDGRGLLGAVTLAADDPRGVPGLMQLRTYLGGACSEEAGLETWEGVFRALRRWLPELGEARQVRRERAPGAFPVLAPGHRARTAGILAALPRGIHWVGAARFGPGLPDLAEGVRDWAAGWCAAADGGRPS